MNAQLDKLKQTLEKETQWPQKFMYKFIVPNQKEKIDEVKKIFERPDKLNFKVSKNIKYISITSKEWVSSPDEVINVYRQAYKIEGLIAL